MFTVAGAALRSQLPTGLALPFMTAVMPLAGEVPGTAQRLAAGSWIDFR